MAFNTKTFSKLLGAMLDSIAVYFPNVDTREGSMVYNACASAAMELAIGYVDLNYFADNSFVPTASRGYKLLGCQDVGINVSVFNATAGVFKGSFNVEVPISSRWNCGNYNFKVTELIGQNELYEYQMVCETTGTLPNTTIGELTPITDIPSGLETAVITECLILGEDEASNDAITEYYLNHVNGTTNDGNVAQYQKWCSDYNGIGNHKIIGLWNGANTVKVSILDTSNRAASETLVKEFQEYLDPLTAELNDNTAAGNYPQGRGMGNGKAPIGAIVTVNTATERVISVTATVKLASGYTEPVGLDDALVTYFSQLAYNNTFVNYLSVGAVILACASVDSVNNLLVNGSTADIELGLEEIPILGTTSWSVAK